MRVGGDHLRADHAFGRIIADLHHLLEQVIGLFVGGVWAQPLDRVDALVTEMRFEADIAVQPDHRVLGLQIALGGNRILVGGELRARQQPADPSATAISLKDQELGLGRIKRVGQCVEVIPNQKRRQQHECR